MRPAARHDSGFSLVEIILAMAIIGLTTGMVVLTVRFADKGLEEEADKLANNLITLSRQAVINGDVRAAGFSTDGYSLYAFDGERWTELGKHDWPDNVAVSMWENRKSSSLDDETRPDWLFEPTAGATPFTLVLSDRRETWRVISPGDGTIETREGRP